MKKNLKKEKGQALVLVIVILGIILAIALGTSHFVSQQIRMLREVGYSVRAFYAADSGIERVLKDNAIPSLPGSVNGASYSISCECRTVPAACPSNCGSTVPGCQAPTFCLRSIGEYQGLRQALHFGY